MKNRSLVVFVFICLSIASMQSLAQIIVCAHPAYVDAIAFVKDSKVLLSSSSTFLYKWDLSGMKLIDTVYNGYAEKIVSDQEGNYFMTGGYYPELGTDVKLWSVNERRSLKTVDRAVPFELAGDSFFLVKDNKNITIETISSNSVINKDWGLWDKAYIRDLVTSRDKEYLAIVGGQEVGNMDYIVHFEIRNLKTGEIVSSYAFPNEFWHHKNNSSVLSSNGEYFACSSDNSIYFFSLKPLKLLDKFKCNQIVESMDFSVDNRFLAIGEEYGYYAIYNTEKNKLQIENPVAVFNKNEQHIMQGPIVYISQGPIELFPERNIRNQWVMDIKYSDDGKYLAFTCSDYVIILTVEDILKK
jgi:WD40 repeat protein